MKSGEASVGLWDGAARSVQATTLSRGGCVCSARFTLPLEKGEAEGRGRESGTTRRRVTNLGGASPAKAWWKRCSPILYACGRALPKQVFDSIVASILPCQVPSHGSNAAETRVQFPVEERHLFLVGDAMILFLARA